MDPVIVLAAIKAVLTLKRQLDTAAMKHAITETQLGLQQVKDRMDDDVLKTLSLGFGHLMAALEGPQAARCGTMPSLLLAGNLLT